MKRLLLGMATVGLFLGVPGQAKADYRFNTLDVPDSTLTEAYGIKQYTVTDLGTLPGSSRSYASGLNAFGQVVGTSCPPNWDFCHAFLWSDGAMTDLGTLPFHFRSSASGINASGQVVGLSTQYQCDEFGCFPFFDRAFLWSDGVMSDLGSLPHDIGSSASGINDSGQVVGTSDSPGPGRAFLWSDGVMSNLGTLPGYDFSWASGINASGEVVGISGRIGGPLHAFLWSDNVVNDLGTLPGYPNSDAHGINTFGQVVGESWSEAGRAFLWSDGVMSDLGTLRGDANSSAFGINASGQVVGTSGGPFPVYRAFLWSDGVMSDLNDLIAPDSGWVLLSAAAINDAGQIVGYGSHNGRSDAAFLLTPSK